MAPRRSHGPAPALWNRLPHAAVDAAAGERRVANEAFPDGIGEAHFEQGPPFARRTRWLALILTSAVMLAALLGAFGGAGETSAEAAAPEARLRVEAPPVARTGQYFEMRIAVAADRPLARPVLAVDEAYWRRITINTMVPAPAEESFEDGAFLFEFAPLEAGETMVFKLDAQINPSRWGDTRGAVALRDDGRVLARVPLRLRVLP